MALCAHLESEQDSVLSRQLGTQVHGRRVMDIICVEPGSEFAERAAITPKAIPALAVESDVGPGTARYWKNAFDCHPNTAKRAIERAVDVGFFERERRNGRTYLRQSTRYPDWYDTLIGIENKPDLARPGNLETQLLTDVTLGLVDKIILATESYVTGAHRNRIPDVVGIWRFDPESGEREILREAKQLPSAKPGVEILERDSSRTEIRIASADEITRARRRVAERAYGKGWRTYDLPACSTVEPDSSGLPYCPWKKRVVRPVEECGPDCGGHNAGDPPDVDFESLRAKQSPWKPDPDGRQRHQTGLDSFY
nr:DUF5787 family protein [Halovenus rubra]